MTDIRSTFHLEKTVTPKPDTAADKTDPDSDSPGKDPYSNTLAISERLDKVLSTDKFSRTLFESDWFRNVLFLEGAQWIKKVGGRWQQRNLPTWFPRAQTNKFAEKCKDLVGQLVTGQRIPITMLPATDEEKDIGMAEVAERMREVYYTEAGTDEIEEELATWVVVTGNAFAVPYYDMDEKHGKSFVQYQTCAACETTLKPEDLADAETDDAGVPTCPDCGGELTPAKSPEGEDIGDDYPIGAIQLDACSPFEIRGDHRVRNIKNWTRFVRQRRYDVDWAKEQWPKYKDVIKPDGGGDDVGQYYLDVISNITSGFSTGAGLLTSGNPSSKTPKCTAYEFYELPSEKYPEGIKAVRIGPDAAAVVEAGPLPTKYGAGVKKGQCFLPLIQFGYELVPGRFWRKTPMNDVIPLQLFRNTVEANIRLSVQRMGNAIWLLPKGCGVDMLTGEPGQTVEYNPISVGGTQMAKPERLAAELNNLGAMIATIKEIDDAIERVSGTFFLQGGQAPPGVTAASALQYLGEKGQQSLSALRSSWAKSWRQFDLIALELARANWDDKRMRVIMGKNKKWQVQNFSKADLQGSVDILIDYNGIAPKSNATEQAKVAQLTQMGMVNPQSQDVRIEILKIFGATKLLGSLDTDITYAAKLQDAFLKGGPIPDIRPLVDNSEVLLDQHIEFAKIDEFLELPKERQQQWLDYCKLRAYDIAARRVYLTSGGIDPSLPATTEIPSALAEAGLVAAQKTQQELQLAQQQIQQANAPQPGAPGGPPQGPPGSGMPGAPTPDIGAMQIGGPEPTVHPAPRVPPIVPNQGV